MGQRKTLIKTAPALSSPFHGAGRGAALSVLIRQSWQPGLHVSKLRLREVKRHSQDTQPVGGRGAYLWNSRSRTRWVVVKAR